MKRKKGKGKIRGWLSLKKKEPGISFDGYFIWKSKERKSLSIEDISIKDYGFDQLIKECNWKLITSSGIDWHTHTIRSRQAFDIIFISKMK